MKRGKPTPAKPKRTASAAEVAAAVGTLKAKQRPRVAKLTKEELAKKREDLMSEAAEAVTDDKPERALELLAEALPLIKSKHQRLRFQGVCQGHGNRYLWKQGWKAAAAFYDAGIAIAKAGDNTAVTADMLAEAGFAWLQLHQLDQAEPRIRRALELHDEAKRATGGANAVYYLSSVIFERGRIDEAVALAREAVKRSHDAGDARGETFHAYSLARALYEQGHSREAEEVSKQALETATALGLTAVQGNFLNMIANVALDDHRLDEGKQAYERAMELFKQAGLKNHQAITTSNLGNLAWDEDRLEDSLELYEEAIKLHAKVKDSRSAAIGLTARAGVFTELGRFAEAEKDLERALAVMTTKQHERRVSFVRAAFARLAEARGELAEARAHYAEAEMSLEVAGDLVEIGRMLYAAAGVEAELGDPESAEALIARAAALDPASLSDTTGVGEKRAGMQAVRALRELTTARIEVARANRIGGEEARALRIAATSRMQAIVSGKDSLMGRSSEVRRVVGRLAAQLAGDAEVQPAIKFAGTAIKTGWKVDTEITGELLVTFERGEMIATGSLAWDDRVGQIHVRGPDVGTIRTLRGTMIAIAKKHVAGGEWQLRVEVEHADKVLRGRFLELYDGASEDEMCTFDWRRT